MSIKILYSLFDLVMTFRICTVAPKLIQDTIQQSLEHHFKGHRIYPLPQKKKQKKTENGRDNLNRKEYPLNSKPL